jgi:hypothetical protein
MDLEHLTKHQIVLLTLLVSFMTSIATGIVTVSLMDQAPPGVTKTINQIVEHTVQTVVPSTQGAAANTATTIKTVVVKDDDLAAQSIGTVQKAIVRIVGKGDDQLIARGVIVDGKGTAITDKGSIEASAYTSFEAILADGTRVGVTIPKGQSASSSIEVVTVTVGTSTGFAAAHVADPSKLQLGQSIIRIGGTGTDIVGEGIVASLPVKDSNDIEASVTSATPGSLIMTLFGEVVGIATTDSLDDGSNFYTLALLPAAPVPATPATPAATKTTPSS